MSSKPPTDSLKTCPGSSKGNDLTTQLTRAVETEYNKLKASTHYSMLQKVEAAVEVTLAALASDSDQDNVRHYINLVCSTGK